MATAKKTPSGKYRVRIFDYIDDNGRKKYKSITAPTKKEAELLAAQYKTGLKHSTELVTIKQALAEYIELKTPVLSPASIRGYRSIERTLLKEYPKFMQRNIKDVTEKDIQGLISAISKNKSPKTVKNYHTLIMSIAPEFDSFKITLPRVAQYEPYIPSEFEVKTLLEALKGHELEVPVMLGAYCMMRRGEICSLSMEDINFRNKTIHIRHSIVLDEDLEWVLKAPKTKKSDRIIKVPDFVLDAIKAKGYIVNYNPTAMTKAFDNMLKNLGLHHFRFHDLRHFAASMYHYRGVPMSYVQKYGGWSTLDTLTKIYQHTLKDKEDKIYAEMNRYFTENRA